MTIKTMSIVLTSILAISCGNGGSNKAESTRSVMLIEPSSLTNSTDKKLSGVVKESGSISIGFKTAGQIEKILVKEGDYVSQGQLLATLDDADYKLGVDAAQAQYEQLKGEVARLKSLYDARSISGNDYEKAVSGLKQVEVNLDVNRNKLSYTKLYAPMSGYVQEVNFENSEMVGAGTPVFTLLDTRNMEVQIMLPVGMYLYRDRMTGFSCHGIFDKTRIPLTLISINPKADNNQLYRTRLALPKGKTGLTPGMNVEVLIDFEGANPQQTSVALPLSAVFEYQEKSYVWVFDQAQSKVSRQEVEVLSVDVAAGKMICSGIPEGASVVRSGVHSLTDGETVKVIEKPASSNVGGII